MRPFLRAFVYFVLIKGSPPCVYAVDLLPSKDRERGGDEDEVRVRLARTLSLESIEVVEGQRGRESCSEQGRVIKGRFRCNKKLNSSGADGCLSSGVT